MEQKITRCKMNTHRATWQPRSDCIHYPSPRNKQRASKIRSKTLGPSSLQLFQKYALILLNSQVIYNKIEIIAILICFPKANQILPRNKKYPNKTQELTLQKEPLDGAAVSSQRNRPITIIEYKSTNPISLLITVTKLITPSKTLTWVNFWSYGIDA